MPHVRAPKKILIGCYFRLDTLEVLEAAADAAGRSRNQEIVARIEASVAAQASPPRTTEVPG